MLNSEECRKALEVLEGAGIPVALTFDFKMRSWSFYCAGVCCATGMATEGYALHRGLLDIAIRHEGKPQPVSNPATCSSREKCL